MRFYAFGLYWSLYWTTWWVRGPRGCFMVKFPWNRVVLFSERTGAWKHRRFMGFRWGWRP